MQESREPQQSTTGSIAYPPVYNAPQNPYYPPAPPVKISAWTRFWRMNRLLLRRLLRGAVVVGRVLRPFAATLVVAIVLFAVIGWMSYMLWGPKTVAPAFQRADSLPPASAVETYIQGQQNYNADMMWDSYSTAFQTALLANGATKAMLQAHANSNRSQGIQFVHADYIGGVQETNGGSTYFYSIELAQADAHQRFPYIFTADPDGKIVDVDSPFLRPPSSQ